LPGRILRTCSLVMDLPSASQPAVRTVEIGPPSARAETWNVLRAAALIVLVTWIYIADTAAPAATGAAATRGAAGPGATGAAAVAAGAAAAGAAAADGRMAADGGDVAAARDLLPYQRLFRTLGGEDQRLFRELHEGLLEAENVRSSARRWPAPAALAAQGVPPFADAPGRGGRRIYRWQLRQEGPTVNYLGLPADARDPALLLLVQEPDPRLPAGGPVSPADAGAPPGGVGPAAGGVLSQATDEVHHRLADGTLLHVSIWMRAAPPMPARAGDDRGLMTEPYARGWVQLLAGTSRQ
jgi:hypothetical protein